jgi:hypothetical protein
VSGNNVTFTGTSEANSTVYVRTLNIVLGTTTSDANGAWTATITLENGTHEINVYARDGAGNRSVASDIRRFGVNTVPEVPPAPSAPDPRSPVDGSLVPGQFKIVGFSDPDVLIRVYEGTTLVGVGGSDGFGNFSADVTLAHGIHTVHLKAENGGGESPASRSLTYDVDATAPTAMFTDPVSKTEDNTYILKDGTVVFQGTAGDDRGIAAIIVSYYDGTIDKNRKADEQVASCSGCRVPQTPNVTWSTRVPDTLLPGNYYAVIRAYDLVGNYSEYDWVRFTKVA